MDARALVAASKFLSYVLRHHPESIGLTLDAAGWAEVDALLERCGAARHPLSRADLLEIVATSPKKRFALSEDGRRVRASQGHSVPVELGYAPAVPPEVLFHGTVAGALAPIRAEGLRRMERHHVHLSPDAVTARAVGQRRGKAVVLEVEALRMHQDGHVFHRSANGVWLTEHVPARYIRFPAGSGR